MTLLEKYWKPLAMILLVAFFLWRVFSFGVGISDGNWRQKWLQRDIADSTATLHREVAERAEELRRQQVVNEEQRRADEELAKVLANAADAERARSGLQQQLRQLQRQLGNSETGRISAAVAAGAAKAETGVLLADLLSKSVERNQQLAKFADESYVAGKTCERIYQGVTNHHD